MPVTIRLEVKQRGPLSPLLFNLILDQALRSISPDVGFRVDDATVRIFAFADDVVIVSSMVFGL